MGLITPGFCRAWFPDYGRPSMVRRRFDYVLQIGSWMTGLRAIPDIRRASQRPRKPSFVHLARSTCWNGGDC